MAEVSEQPRDVLDTERAGGLILRGGILRLGGYVLGTGLSVASAAVLTRHLGVGRFGQYTTVLSLIAVVGQITDAGMANLGSREYVTRQGSERDELMRSLFGLRVVLTLGGVVLALLFALAAGYSSALLGGTVLAGLGVVLLVVQDTFAIPLSTSLRLGRITALELGRQLMTVALVLVLAAVGAGVLPFLAVGVPIGLVLVPAAARMVRGEIPTRPSLRRTAWRGLLRPSIVFALANAVGTVYVYTAQVLTSLVADRHQSGLFAASFRIFIVGGAAGGLLVNSAFPLLARAARDDRERLGYALRRLSEVSLVFGAAAAVGGCFGARAIVDVIAGVRYHGTIEVLRIQAWALLPSALVTTWAFALLSLRRHRVLLLANLLALVLSAVLTLALASAHGATGAAVATLVAETLLAALLLLALQRAEPAFRPPLATVPKVAAAAGAAAALWLALPAVSPVVPLVACPAVYGAVVLALRAVPRELTELLPRRTR